MPAALTIFQYNRGRNHYSIATLMGYKYVRMNLRNKIREIQQYPFAAILRPGLKRECQFLAPQHYNEECLSHTKQIKSPIEPCKLHSLSLNNLIYLYAMAAKHRWCTLAVQLPSFHMFPKVEQYFLRIHIAT